MGPWWHWGASIRAIYPAIAPLSPIVTQVLLPAVGALQVNQDPPELWAAAGTNVSLRCQLQTAQRWTMARVTWLKDGGHEVLCEHRVTHLPPKATTMPCATPHIHLTWSPPHANLSLHGAQEGDAGRYVCHVTIEVPYLATATGNGTMLHVSAGADGDHGAGLTWELCGAVGGTVLLVGLISLGCCCCRRRRADTSDIYVNMVPHRTPRDKNPQGAAAGGRCVQGGLDRTWNPPSLKG
ncbi:transmembrane and immunoglobulin domain-containing protein 2 [Coturnix japonica]|uniref:transmembrane and immunoglobulin domain-containing protein 2 n=1 Tax=Coturnix japonica TaxID=93934 RepID=UPI000777BC17|nr:transmembrane and immunoglobulin domain-containing protein 2 [Coturnix japonica]